jgi:hypothetical protein
MPFSFNFLSNPRSSESIPLRQVEVDERETMDPGDGDEDDAPLLPDSALMIERIKNELDNELSGADGYERKYHESWRYQNQLNENRQARVGL